MSGLRLLPSEPEEPSLAGQVAYEMHVTVTHGQDGGLLTSVAYEGGTKTQREAAAHLRTVCAHMEDREADVAFSLVIGADPDPEDQDFPWRWEADWYVTDEAGGLEDLATRVDVLRRVLAVYEGDL